jgi:cytoskeletal protein CcmA (bactofilin family)
MTDSSQSKESQGQKRVANAPDPAGHQSTSKPRVSTIAEDLIITGNVMSKGEIQLLGKVHGDIHCHSLILGDQGELTGNVVAENVEASGRLIGSVRALGVTLQATCHIEGELLHQSLIIQRGAYFEGKSRHFEGPLLTDQAVPEERIIDRPKLGVERPETSQTNGSRSEGAV